MMPHGMDVACQEPRAGATMVPPPYGRRAGGYGHGPATGSWLHCGAPLNRGTTNRMITDPGSAPPAAAGDPAAAAAAVRVSGLRKRYGDVVALAGVDLV